MYIIPQRAKKSTNKIIKFDKKFTVSGVISIYLAYTIKNEVSNSRRNILKKKNIHLDIICSEPVKTFIQTESLDIILINLIQNATDAMKENGNLTIKVLKSHL